MTSHRTEFDRRSEQLEDVLELIKSSGLRLVLQKNGSNYAVSLVQGDWDEYALAFFVDLED